MTIIRFSRQVDGARSSAIDAQQLLAAATNRVFSVPSAGRASTIGRPPRVNNDQHSRAGAPPESVPTTARSARYANCPASTGSGRHSPPRGIVGSRVRRNESPGGFGDNPVTGRRQPVVADNRDTKNNTLPAPHGDQCPGAQTYPMQLLPADAQGATAQHRSTDTVSNRKFTGHVGDSPFDRPIALQKARQKPMAAAN